MNARPSQISTPLQADVELIVARQIHFILYNRLVPITFGLYWGTQPHECNEPNLGVVYPKVVHR